MKYFILTLLIWIPASKAWSQPFGYGFVKQITIQSTQVSGGVNLTDFPVLISITADNDLRTTGNGGDVTNANGYDIIFTTEDCLTQLDHQIEAYTATTGAFRAWVRIPTLSASANTVIHMYYGNNSVTTNPSTTSVWDSNYEGVWHFQNSVNDNSANGNNLTNNSTTNLGAGKIGAARNLNNNTDILSSNASGRYLQLPNGFFSGMTNFTFEGWVTLDRSSTNWERIFDFGRSTTVNFFLCPSTGTGGPAPTVARITTGGAAAEQGPVSGNVTNTGSWVHWGVVLDNSTSSMTIYKNGAVLATASGTVTLTPNALESSTANYFGRSQYGADHYIDALFDEFRISSSARTAGWITTSNNNQNTPTSFYSISAESTAISLCSILPIELSYFKASINEDGVTLDWSTSTEINNDYFTIERSGPELKWESIGSLPGAGNTNVQNDYQFIDKKPIIGRSYYRLRQTDYNGTETLSNVVTVFREQATEHGIAISLDNENVIISLNNSSITGSLTIYNLQGAIIVQDQINHTGVYNRQLFLPGVYLVILQQGNKTYSEKIFIL